MNLLMLSEERNQAQMEEASVVQKSLLSGRQAEKSSSL